MSLHFLFLGKYNFYASYYSTKWHVMIAWFQAKSNPYLVEYLPTYIVRTFATLAKFVAGELVPPNPQIFLVCVMEIFCDCA